MNKRKKPFSGKKKKEQLKEKRQRRSDQVELGSDTSIAGHLTRRNARKRQEESIPEKDRFRTVFEKEPQHVIEERKLRGMKPIVRSRKDHFDKLYSTIIDIPKRPYWDENTTKEQLEHNETTMFKNYLENIYDTYSYENLNYFEHNLEVWRELWRTCEMSDVLLIMADIRHPMFHFPPALYNFVTKTLKKRFVLILTKCDLVPKENILQWKQYFETTFKNLDVCVFSSFKKTSFKDADGKEMTMKKRRAMKRTYQPTGVEELWEILRSYEIKKKGRLVNIEYEAPHQGSIEDLLGEKLTLNEDDEDEGSDEEDEKAVETERDEALRSFDEEFDDFSIRKERSYLTLGLIGNPNVGKSTFINALKGYRVCSTSRTPGHTKRRQTIFLTKEVMLCDCPGLIFPAVDMPKELQILCGIYPIAQVREPYSAITYLSQFVPVEGIYKLEPPEQEFDYDPEKGEIEWSAWRICEAYAAKRGYHNRQGRLDVHRAGREILFDVIDGRIVLYFLPNQSDVDIGFYVNEEAMHDPLRGEKRNVEDDMAPEEEE